MKIRLVVLLSSVALFGLAVAGYGLAADAGISLTSTGPEPAAVTVNWGDTVTFTNRDGVEHVIAIPGLDYTSPAIAPEGALEYTFTGRSANFRFVQRGNENFSGQIRVTTQGSVTLKASSAVVPWGQSVVLSGRSTFPGTPVVVSSREAGAGGPLTPALTTTAGPDGSYTGRIRLERGARYQARVAAGQIASSTVTVTVRPRVTIAVPRRTGAAGSTITVSGVITPGRSAERADLTSYDSERKRWVTMQTRPIPQSGRVRFRPKLEEGVTRVRIQVRRTEPGYVAAESRIVRVVGTKNA